MFTQENGIRKEKPTDFPISEELKETYQRARINALHRQSSEPDCKVNLPSLLSFLSQYRHSFNLTFHLHYQINTENYSVKDWWVKLFKEGKTEWKKEEKKMVQSKLTAFTGNT